MATEVIHCCTGTPTCTGIPGKLLTHTQSFQELIFHHRVLANNISKHLFKRSCSKGNSIVTRFCPPRWYIPTIVIHPHILQVNSSNSNEISNVASENPNAMESIKHTCLQSRGSSSSAYSMYSATCRFRPKVQRLLSFLLSNVHSSAGDRRLPGSISTGFLTLRTTPDQDRTASKVKKNL